VGKGEVVVEGAFEREPDGYTWLICRCRWWASSRSRTCLLSASNCFWPGGVMDHDSDVGNGVGEKRVEGAGRIWRHSEGKFCA
jgi:hypothetical protein